MLAVATAMITYDARGVVLGWSAEAALLSGFAEGEVVGKPLSAVLEGAPAGDVEPGEADERAAVLLTRSGQRLRVQRTRSPIRDRRGAIVAYAEILCAPDADTASGAQALPSPSETLSRDVRGAEEAQRRLRQVADGLRQLVWRCDADGLCTYLNKGWEAYIGVPSESLLGSRWLEYIHPDDRERVVAIWQSCVETQREYYVECRLLRHDGEYRWIEARATALRDVEGRVLEWLGCDTDVHDARMLQETL